MVPTYIHTFCIQHIPTVILQNVCVCYEISCRWVRWTTLQRSVGINFCGFLHFNPLWAPSFWSLHVVKAMPAVGSDEMDVSPRHSGYRPLFSQIGRLLAWSNSIGYSFMFYRAQLRTPCHNEGPIIFHPAKSHIHSPRDFFFPLDCFVIGIFLLALQRCPLLLVRYTSIWGPL